MKIKKTLVLLITSAMLLQNTVAFAGTNLDSNRTWGLQFENKEIIDPSVELNKTSDSLKVGETEVLLPKMTSPLQLVAWSSSNSSVATVNMHGKITGVRLGTATITVRSIYYFTTATCQITVKEDTTDIVKFKDKKLEELVRHTINKPIGDLYKSDVENITKLESTIENRDPFSGEVLNGYINDSNRKSKIKKITQKITQLNGIENLTNLSCLELDGNEINDLGPLKGLKNLKTLQLGNNCISDISELHGLANLEQIGLSHNKIEDITPLGGFKNLNSIDLSYNKIKKVTYTQISDICSFEGVYRLNSIYLVHNEIDEANKAEINARIGRCSF